jgi:lipoprotein-anchoring transpeptidase ErfK/SrfK
MQRALLLLCLALPFFTSAASAGYRATLRGDPLIDAQWAAQLQAPPAVYGRNAPIDLRGTPRGGLLNIFLTPPDAVVRAPAGAQQPREVDPAFLPAIVDYAGKHGTGTVIIDTTARYLYLVEAGGKARRYGVGVGRDGFGWSGSVTVGRKAEWPTWTPPAEMRKRQPHLPVSMAGGPHNPLGARALYLHDNGRDTLYRIHGSNEPWTIGRAVSSGCFRMRNEDIIDLYARVPVGAHVVVR